MGALQAFNPDNGLWEVINTQGPIGAQGPTGPVGEQGIQGVAGGANVLYRSPYSNSWTSGTGVNVLETVYTAEVDIADLSGDFMVVCGWRCCQDFGTGYNQVQLQVDVGSYRAPTHSVFSAAGEQGLWGGVSRVWFPTGSAIAAAPGPVTVSMKVMLNVASKIIYDPSLVLIQLNSASAAVAGATGPTGPAGLDGATGPTGPAGTGGGGVAGEVVGPLVITSPDGAGSEIQFFRDDYPNYAVGMLAHDGNSLSILSGNAAVPPVRRAYFGLNTQITGDLQVSGAISDSGGPVATRAEVDELRARLDRLESRGA